ncbi:MAG: cyclic nucleotide-binding domain-containing protein [Desulfobacterales bacterium]
MIVRDFLKNIDIFKALDDDQLTAIASSFHEREYKQGDKLFEEGEQASHIWIVAEGQVDLRFDLPGRSTSTRTTISTISERMVFGWSGLVPPHEYTLSAYCATRSLRVVRGTRDSLTALFQEDPEVGYRVMSNLIKVVGRRFQQVQALTSPMPISQAKVTVHMGTCGISAGAREVMAALLEEKNKTDRQDIQIKSSGCIGKCKEEPNVTVEIDGQETVIYRNVNANKARQIFENHLLKGEVMTDYVLTEV